MCTICFFFLSSPYMLFLPHTLLHLNTIQFKVTNNYVTVPFWEQCNQTTQRADTQPAVHKLLLQTSYKSTSAYLDLINSPRFKVFFRTSRSGLARTRSISITRSCKTRSCVGCSFSAIRRSNTISFTLLSLSLTMSSM